MLGFLLKDKVINTIVERITQEVNKSLSQFSEQNNQTLTKISDNIEKLRFELKDLEQQVMSKEIKSRSDYGQIQYQLNALQNQLREEKKPKRKEINPSH
jgi:SPX domain protein involved in polyphosphate accumulation